MDKHYPTIDIAFFISILQKNTKVISVCKEGRSSAYILKGSRPIAERIVVIRQTEGCVDLHFATGTAIKLKCLSELLIWLEKNRNWKDGAYFVPQNDVN